MSKFEDKHWRWIIGVPEKGNQSQETKQILKVIIQRNSLEIRKYVQTVGWQGTLSSDSEPMAGLELVKKSLGI